MKVLPTSYDTLPYMDYIVIMNKIPSEKPDELNDSDWSRLIHLGTLSILLGVSENEVENMRAIKVGEMIKTISFLDEPPKETKNSFAVKKVTELTYDEFSTYQRLRIDQWNNLHAILSLMLVEVSPESIEAFSTQDAMNVFFCLNRSTQKYLTRLKYLTLLRATWQTIKRMYRFWRPSESLKRESSGSVGVG